MQSIALPCHHQGEQGNLVASAVIEKVGNGCSARSVRAFSMQGAGILYCRGLSTIEAFIKACQGNEIDLGSPIQLRECWRFSRVASQKGELTLEKALRDLAKFITVEATRNAIIESVL